MAMLNSTGFAHVHESAYRGYVKAVERFVEMSPDNLELETNDDLHATPLLVSCMGGHLECVEVLVRLGARLTIRDGHNRGVVETATNAGEAGLEILKFLLELDNSNLPVFRHLIALVVIDVDEEAQTAAAKAIDYLAMNFGTESSSKFCDQLVDAGFISTLLKVFKSPLASITVRTLLTSALVHVTRLSSKARDQILAINLLPTLSNFLRVSSTAELISVCGTVLFQLLQVDSENFIGPVVEAGVLPNVVAALNALPLGRAVAVTPLIDMIGLIASVSPVMQSEVSQTPDLVPALSRHFSVVNSQARVLLRARFSDQPVMIMRGGSLVAMNKFVALGHANRDLYFSLLVAISRLVNDNSANQLMIVESMPIIQGLMALTKSKARELQLAAVGCLASLGDGHPICQRKLAEAGALVSLMQLLKKARSDEVREHTVIALWSLAGGTIEEKRNVATLVGVPMLVEFLGSKSETLLIRACQALETLCLGPHNKQAGIGGTPGIWRLARLVTMPMEGKPQLICAALSTIRGLLIGPSYVTHKRNQEVLIDKRLMDLLIDNVANHKEPTVRVWSGCTLAAALLANQTNAALVKDSFGSQPSAPSTSNVGGSSGASKPGRHGVSLPLVSLMSLLFNEDLRVSQMAGHTLATLAFNSLERQHAIDMANGLRLKPFAKMLQSENRLVRIDAAFQLVVLSRLLPDANPAAVCARAIHSLSTVLRTSTHPDELYLAAEVVCRLLRLKTGVARALVAMGLVEQLCTHLLSPVDLVRGASAIGLAHFSRLPDGCRQLLRKCVKDPFLYDILQFYNDKTALSGEFVDAWRHCRMIGSLPPVPPARRSLLNAEHGVNNLRKPAHGSVAPAAIDESAGAVAVDDLADTTKSKAVTKRKSVSSVITDDDQNDDNDLEDNGNN